MCYTDLKFEMDVFSQSSELSEIKATTDLNGCGFFDILYSEYYREKIKKFSQGIPEEFQKIAATNAAAITYLTLLQKQSQRQYQQLQHQHPLPSVQALQTVP